MQAAVLVELGVVAVAEEPAVAEVSGHAVVFAGRGNPVGQIAEDRQRFGQPLPQRRDRRPLSEHLRKLLGPRGALAQPHQVAWRGPADGQAGGDPRHVVHAVERPGELIRKPRVVHQGLHHPLPVLDRVAVGQGIAQPVAQPPLAHRRDTPTG